MPHSSVQACPGVSCVSRSSLLNSYRFKAETAQVLASSGYQVAPSVSIGRPKARAARVEVGLPEESPVGVQTPAPTPKSNCLGCQERVLSAKKSPIPKVLLLYSRPAFETQAGKPTGATTSPPTLPPRNLVSVIQMARGTLAKPAPGNWRARRCCPAPLFNDRRHRTHCSPGSKSRAAAGTRP